MRYFTAGNNDFLALNNDIWESDEIIDRFHRFLDNMTEDEMEEVDMTLSYSSTINAIKDYFELEELVEIVSGVDLKNAVENHDHIYARKMPKYAIAVVTLDFLIQDIVDDPIFLTINENNKFDILYNYQRDHNCKLYRSI